MNKQEFENKILEIFRNEEYVIKYINYHPENNNIVINYIFDYEVITYSLLTEISKLTNSINIFVNHETDYGDANEFSIELHDFIPSDVTTDSITILTKYTISHNGRTRR